MPHTHLLGVPSGQGWPHLEPADVWVQGCLWKPLAFLVATPHLSPFLPVFYKDTHRLQPLCHHDRKAKENHRDAAFDITELPDQQQLPPPAAI